MTAVSAALEIAGGVKNKPGEKRPSVVVGRGGGMGRKVTDRADGGSSVGSGADC